MKSMLSPSPKPIRKNLGFIFLAIIYTSAISFISIGLYKKHQTDRLKAINPHSIIQQALVNDLSLSTVTRHITYRDNVDRSMLVSWDVQSDFSNFRDPKSSGTLTIDYLRNKTDNIQKVEFIAIKGMNQYSDVIYARMVKGNELTNAPKNWFSFEALPLIFDLKMGDNLKALYQRDDATNTFKTNTTIPGFENFKAFNIAVYNSPIAYIITSNLRNSQEKAKITSELQKDSAYALQNCNHDAKFSWCGGSTIIGGLESINTNLATSEGGPGDLLGQANNSSQFWLTADNTKQLLTKLEVDISSFGNEDKYIVDYGHYNEPVSVKAPAGAVKI